MRMIVESGRLPKSQWNSNTQENHAFTPEVFVSQESWSVAEHTPALEQSATCHNKNPGRPTLSLSEILGENPTTREIIID